MQRHGSALRARLRCEIHPRRFVRMVRLGRRAGAESRRAKRDRDVRRAADCEGATMTPSETPAPSRVPICAHVAYFLKLGALGFGEPGWVLDVDERRLSI